MQQSIWQSILEYARIDWDVARKDTEKATIYDDPIGKYDKVWGRKELFCHRDNTKTMHWNIRVPTMGLLIDVYVVYSLQGVMLPPSTPKRAHPSLYVGSLHVVVWVFGIEQTSFNCLKNKKK